MKDVKPTDRAFAESINRRRWLRNTAIGTGIVSALAVARQLPFAAAHPGHDATPEGSPVASPASGTPSASPAAGTDATVTISGQAFAPEELTVAAGTTVTWVNDDSEPHTATGNDREALQSGTLMPGDSFSQAFSEAGTIEYFCEFHAGMRGTLIVT
jgi:plastocyanin